MDRLTEVGLTLMEATSHAESSTTRFSTLLFYDDNGKYGAFGAFVGATVSIFLAGNFAN